jgi:hypothetical protein
MIKEQTYWVNIDGERQIAKGEVLDEIIASITENEIKKANQAQIAADQAQAKAALLQRLGITADEAALLLA